MDLLHILLLQLQLIHYMIAGTNSAMVSSTQVQHFLKGTKIHDIPHQNYTKCPMWYNYSSATNECECLSLLGLKCDGLNAFMHPGQTLTYNSQDKLVSVTSTRYRHLDGYNTTKEGYILLPSDVSELNQYMCGPLSRINHLCSECKNGYGPPMVPTLCTNACYICQNSWYSVILYLLLELVPITVVYFLILVLQIKLTSAPMTCFIFYSQLIVMAFDGQCADEMATNLFSQIKLNKNGDLRTETKIIRTLYGIFNLDFFHTITPPFCISSKLKPVHSLLLSYASAFYPFLLILLTWLCVDLHGRNYRPIVFLWRPFHRCFVGLRRSWNTKSDLVDVFASLFLLSYSKIMYLIVLSSANIEIQNYSLVDGHVTNQLVLGVDARIMVHSTENFFIITVTVLVSFTFVVIPTLLLLLFPTQIFQRLLSQITSNRIRIILTIFVEKFQSCYKDGLDNAQCRRSFSGLYFLLSAGVLLIEAINRSTFKFEAWFARGFAFTFISLLVAFSRPYKRTYVTIVDSVLFSHLALLCYLISANHRTRFYLYYIHAIILLPFTIFGLIIAYRLFRGMCKVYSQWLPMRQWKKFRIRAYRVKSTDWRQSSPSKTTYGTLTLH